MITPHQLHEKCWNGLKYFEQNNSKVGTPVWKKFKEEVLLPYSQMIGHRLGIDGTQEIMMICQKFGGFFVHPGKKIKEISQEDLSNGQPKG